MKKLLRAFEEKDISTVTSLLVNGCTDPNALIPDKGVSPFHLIVGNQSETFAFKVTKIFLRCGGDPNVPSSDGVTPTHVAAAWGRTRILHLLLVNGGDPWIQDDDKKNAFNYAFEEREWEAVEMLHHFQQMHSAANSKREFGFEPKFEINLERVLVRKGEEMYAFVPNENETKSVTTQTQLDYPDVEPASPIHDKIKYFETSPVLLPNGNKSEKHGWCKDFYQTSCEVMVHCDAKNLEDSSEKKEENKNQIFVTTVQIDTSPPKSKPEPEPVKKPEIKDMKSQLHMELQEAVRKRSLKMQKAQEEKKTEPPKNPKNPIQESNSYNISGVEPLESNNSNVRVSSLYGIRLQSNKLIKSISDVMSDFEFSKTDTNGTIDLCNSSPAINSTYFTCGEESDGRESDCRVVEMHRKDDKDLSINVTQNYSNDSFVSIAEEYRYTDVEEGVDLVEKNLLVTPAISLISDDDDSKNGDGSSITSIASSVPSTFSYASDRLRFELTNLGFNPGPIIKTTKKLYLKKLWRLKKNKPKDKPKPSVEEAKYTYPLILEKSLTDENFLQEIPTFVKLEEDMSRSFENTKRKWREGSSKTSFNYLLLDSRVSLNLPKRAENLTKAQIWECFLSAIFYVGKGKRTRPYAHLYQAVEIWRKQDSSKTDSKIQHIIDIWKDDLGVVCLHVFQNIIPVEAYTREAAMIDAIGLSHLKNIKNGEYYGVAATWSKKNKIKFGLYLLYKAMLIFLSEGERQIRPLDIS